MSAVAITHPGQAHRDEVLALSFLVAAGHVGRIERREPTPAELNDPSVWVIDVGGAHDPALRDFDHHQFERGTVSSSALLVAEHLGLCEALSLESWWESTHHVDSRGPVATARHFGGEGAPFPAWAWGGPFEGALLGLFGAAKVVSPGDVLWAMLEALGAETLRHAQGLQVMLEHARRVCRRTEVGGYYADPTAGYVSFPSHGAEEYVGGVGVLIAEESVDSSATSRLRDELEAAGKPVAVLIAPDDRGSGWTLYRYSDHPRVDFSRLEGEEGILFAHKGGFIAKTRGREGGIAAALSLVAKALK